MQVLFQLRENGTAWPEGGHTLAGEWVAESALLVAEGAGRFIITIGGEDTAAQVWLPSGGRRHFRIGLLVPSGQALGVRAVGASPAGSLTVELWRAGRRVLPTEEQTVVYRHGAERIVLYRYAAETRSFVAVAERRLAGRAVIESDADGFRIEVAGIEVLRSEGDGLVKGVPWRTGSTALPGGGPRIEFWTGSHRVATMGHMHAAWPFWYEAAEIVPAPGEFALPALGGVPRLAFGAAGAQVLAVEEA